MAIVKMTHFSLLYFSQYREEILQDLQRFRDVHFVNLTDEESYKDLESVRLPENMEEVSTELSHLEWMVEILKPYDERPSGLKAMKEGVPEISIEELISKGQDKNYEKTYYELRNHVEEMDTLKQEKASLLEKKNEYSPWKSMNYDPKDFNLTQSQVVLGYVAKRFLEPLKEDLKSLNLTVTEEYGYAGNSQYLLFVTHDSEIQKLQEILRKYGFNEVTLKASKPIREELSDLDQRLQELDESLKKKEEELPRYAKELPLIELHYEAARLDGLRYGSTSHFKKTAMFDVVEGYVPSSEYHAFKELMDKKYEEVSILEAKEVGSKEEAPIKLKNNKFFGAFESLTRMYSMPKYSEIDPTPLFAPFYLFFFGMMVADIGYGLVLFIGSLIALKFFNLKPGMRTFIRLFHFLSYGVIFWGLIYGSFFGGIIGLPSLIDTQTDFIPLLLLSIAFGALHIFVALGIKAYLLIRDKDYKAVFFDVISWYFALIGAALFLISSVLGLPEVIKTTGMILMIVGMLTILLFAAREAKGIGGRLAGGAYELYGISSYVGDLVSYSRLMAIGLAGGFIGFAVNMIVDMLSGNIIGYIFGFIIFVIFHAFNIFLSLLSGYVHTARLTYVEFFGKFYEGGGKSFREFVTEPKYLTFKEKN